ncbi:MAG: ribonuclease P protein component [Paludibacter sp.]|nr:ribonuclease P protein component [Paludibacter sp.]
MPLFTFPKKEKLCGDIRIGKLFSEGNAFIVYPLRIVYKLSEEKSDTPVKVLISVPKKKIRKAVDRNRIKRLIREVYRLNKAEFITAINEKELHLNLAITYVSDKEADFSLIQEKIRLAFPRILSTINDQKERK